MRNHSYKHAGGINTHNPQITNCIMNNGDDDNDNLDLPTAVATLVPPPPNIYGEVLDDLPHTTTTIVDRLTNAHDGTLSITVKNTTFYHNGYRAFKIDHYQIPSNMAREVSESLDNGQMPSSSYMTMMGQHTLPPGMPEVLVRSDASPPSGNDNGIASGGGGTTAIANTATAIQIHQRENHPVRKAAECFNCAVHAGAAPARWAVD